jgi:hypothetical protein
MYKLTELAEKDIGTHMEEKQDLEALIYDG